MDVNSLPKTVTRQRRDCDLDPGPSAPESSTLPSHPSACLVTVFRSPFYSASGREAEHCDEHVCLSVCLFARVSCTQLFIPPARPDKTVLSASRRAVWIESRDSLAQSEPRRLYILCWREHSRRKLSPTLATPTILALTTLVAQCELSRR